jgi:ornithine carbamoyltransferase
MSTRHLVDLTELSPSELRQLLRIAAGLKSEVKAGHFRPVLGGKAIALLFQKPSLRTRVSFDVGMAQLGGRAIYLSPDEVGLGTRECIPDVARVLSRFVDGIVARTNEHRTVEQLAAYSTIPVINGLSDYSHPCQALADYLTIEEKLGQVAGVRIAYIGDGNNVAHSLMLGGAMLGATVVVASPEGFHPANEVVERAKAIATETGGCIDVTTSPAEAARGADVVYTDVWTSMGQEAEAGTRLQAFQGYQVNADLVRLARPGALVMHDLPAHRGEEITSEVLDGPQSVAFDQAENRLHGQKAALVLLLGKDPFREGR